jgi:hypothetical protein
VSIEIDAFHDPGRAGAVDLSSPSAEYRVRTWIRLPNVNFRMHRLWRSDNRYPGTVSVRRHESGGLELSFDALRHGAKPRPPVIIAPDQVDPFILSCLEVRPRG